jgi:LacI family transcriptional regulator
MKIPARQSLVSQTAEALRQGIRQRDWIVRLPGERALAAQLAVSRPTLRFALTILQHEGWIGGGRPRCQRRILRQRAAVGAARTTGRATLLCDGYPQQISARLRCIVDALRQTLPNHAVQLEVLPYPSASPRRLPQALETLVRERPGSVWILSRATSKAQEWFASQPLPALLYGTAYPGVQLPSLAIDHRAVCRHAVGLFLRRGYRQLAMVSTTLPAAGDSNSEDEFLSAAASATRGGAPPSIVRFDGTRPDLLRKLEALWRTAVFPLAILCDQATHALTVLGHALRAGLAVPGDLALVARMYEPLLSWTVPVLAHYDQDVVRITRKMTRLTLALLDNGPLPARAYRLIPDFVPGETLGNARGS